MYICVTLHTVHMCDIWLVGILCNRYVCMYVLCMCTHVCMCVCVCVCEHTYIHTYFIHVYDPMLFILYKHMYVYSIFMYSIYIVLCMYVHMYCFYP